MRIQVEVTHSLFFSLVNPMKVLDISFAVWNQFQMLKWKILWLCLYVSSHEISHFTEHCRQSIVEIWQLNVTLTACGSFFSKRTTSLLHWMLSSLDMAAMFIMGLTETNVDFVLFLHHWTQLKTCIPYTVCTCCYTHKMKQLALVSDTKEQSWHPKQ